MASTDARPSLADLSGLFDHQNYTAAATSSYMDGMI